METGTMKIKWFTWDYYPNMEWKTGFRMVYIPLLFSFPITASPIPICSSHPFYFFLSLGTKGKGEEKEHC